MTKIDDQFGFTDPSRPDRWDADAVLPERRSNREATVSHHLEAALVPVAFGLFRLLGLDRASGFLGKALRIIGPLLRPVHRRGLNNLKLVYPDQSDAQHQTILKQAWENLGRTVAEYPHLSKISAFGPDPRITFSNPDKLAMLINSDQQLIFVSAHLANWETMPMALYQAGLRNAIVYRAANNPIVDEKIIQMRSKVITRHKIPKGKRGGRAIMTAMKNGLSMCMLVDQKLNTGIASPFLGHSAMTAPATARMALRYDAPCIPLSVRRINGAHFVITVHDAVTFETTGDIGTDTQALTDAINAALSEIIDSDPGQWLWFHNRWPKKATTVSE